MSFPRRGLLAVSLTTLLLPIACTKQASKLPAYDVVPKFTMIDSEGHPFDSSALAGKVWIADFIYTSCPGPCPRMTSQMHKLQQQLKSDGDVRLVSFSVDPQHDSPAVLNDFAHRFGGPADDWIFLTGSPDTVHLVAYKTFHTGDVIGNIDHSTKFVLVDKRGVIRGYYSSLEGDSIHALLGDLDVLRKESS